jgi:hypothetical protein
MGGCYDYQLIKTITIMSTAFAERERDLKRGEIDETRR